MIDDLNSINHVNCQIHLYYNMLKKIVIYTQFKQKNVIQPNGMSKEQNIFIINLSIFLYNKSLFITSGKRREEVKTYFTLILMKYQDDY